MPHRLINRIRQNILSRDYDLTIHAIEEMAEDDLDILDMNTQCWWDKLSEEANAIHEGQNTRLRAWP